MSGVTPVSGRGLLCSATDRISCQRTPEGRLTLVAILRERIEYVGSSDDTRTSLG